MVLGAINPSQAQRIDGFYATTGNKVGFTPNLNAIAQFETEIRAERQMDCINKAKERGVAFGRKRKMTTQQIEELRERRKSGVLIKTLMADYNLSKASVYRYLGADDN